MKSVLNAAMRKAGQLTRNRDLIAATKVIQRALSGLGKSDERPAPPQAPAGPAATGDSSTGFHFPHIKRPLGKVVELLREAHAHPLYASPPPGADSDAGSALENASSAAASATPAVARERGAFAARRYACKAGARDYKLYVPGLQAPGAAAMRGAGARPALIIMLHGCTQGPDDFAAGTKMNTLAEEFGFIVAYPKQDASANQSGCWNWFLLKDQMRETGEPRIISGITREIMQEFNVDPGRVYVAGLSAGGAMAAVMSATYPELYAAAGVHSGLAYKSASDLLSGLTAMRGKSNPALAATKYRDLDHAHRAVRTIVFHGGSDQTVHPSNGEMIVAEARARIAPGDHEVQTGVSAGGRAYVRTIMTDEGGTAVVEHWEIEGLGHAWSGGDPRGSYTDPRGPDASRQMLRFFFDGPGAEA
ncbi:extracellular catalytic domain type 1 short-chain-length polyhydroxyalkanoate depolymerase [Methylocapsa palsarum]|uniref:Esterase, PHB depolymerase family n=1 Tax=Methylocapsa palsarum TaxID=1612308 RepID=A0A1I4AI59_9HYPH|nr:PHB depolymerase family esterase [Methylocapsa palsarum]SFK55439.1 esterase, PHB depolymerase family [Methylocapsa palsarum]